MERDIKEKKSLLLERLKRGPTIIHSGQKSFSWKVTSCCLKEGKSQSGRGRVGEQAEGIYRRPAGAKEFGVTEE